MQPMHRWLRPAMVLLLSVPASAAVGQAPPAARGALTTFADSVRRIGDVAGLERGLSDIAGGRDHDRAGRESRLGWLAFRLGELGDGRERLDEAVRHFDEAIYRDPAWAAPWLGLAETKLLLAERMMPAKRSMHQGDGVYYEDAALEHLVAALRLQPRYPAAVALLAKRLLGIDAPTFRGEHAEAIRLAAAQAENGPVPQLLLARYLRQREQPDSAAAALARYESLGGDAGLAGLELARVRYQQGRDGEAVRAYLAGARLMGVLGRAALRRDLVWLASPEELEAFDRLPADSLGPWTERLWARRDAAALRPVGDRLKEHLRRWAYAQQNFRIVGRQKHRSKVGIGPSGMAARDRKNADAAPSYTGTVAAKARGLDDAEVSLSYNTLYGAGTFPEVERRALNIDHRGLIYLRHGEPSLRVSSPGRGGTEGCDVANESWRYDLPDRQLVFHFCASLALGTASATTLVPMLDLDADMLESRVGLDGRYWGLASQVRNGNLPPETLRRITEEGRRTIAEGLRTDSYLLLFKHALEPTVQIYAVGEPDAAANRALVVFAIPGERLQPEFVGERLAYPLRLRISAVDTLRGITRMLDTLRLFATRDTLRKGQYLSGTQELPLPPGSYQLRALLEQRERNAAGAVGRAAVGATGTPGQLTLSDLVPGAAGSGLEWSHRGRRIPLNPLDSYAPGSELQLYYELGGAVRGREYRTEARLARTGIGGKAGSDGVTLSFTDRADAAEMALQRTIGLGRLEPGRYLLIVTVREEGGQRSASRELTVNIQRPANSR
jgi:tetratricopeptide (TPR) repeat protein